jgi:hypothetical protein
MHSGAMFQRPKGQGKQIASTKIGHPQQVNKQHFSPLPLQASYFSMLFETNSTGKRSRESQFQQGHKQACNKMMSGVCKQGAELQ